MRSITHNFLNPAHSAYVTGSALYFGPTIWVQIPSEIRNKKFLVGFKRKIKKWKPTDCPIVSLIIHISWLLILRIHLLKKILPVTSILGHVTFIYHFYLPSTPPPPPPPLPPYTHTQYSSVKNLWTHKITTRKSVDPRNSQEKKVRTDPPDPQNLVHFVKND